MLTDSDAVEGREMLRDLHKALDEGEVRIARAKVARRALPEGAHATWYAISQEHENCLMRIDFTFSDCNIHNAAAIRASKALLKKALGLIEAIEPRGRG